VGICGQGPSDHIDFAEFLVEQGIDSISLNPDTYAATKRRIAVVEQRIHQDGGSTQKWLRLFGQPELSLKVDSPRISNCPLLGQRGEGAPV
jgi:hypothetical protein